MLRLADYIADFLYKNGVDVVFMMSGGGAIYLDDGVMCHPHLKYVGVKNEATAPMMAEAYARLKGGIGAVYVTTGPGGTNAVTGVAEAWVDSAPIIVISGQAPRKQTTYYSNINGIRTIGCQELDIVEIVKPITKYATMVKNPTSIRWIMEKAIHTAKVGRPGPVWIDVPLDIQSATIEEDDLDSFTPKLDHVQIDPEILDEVIDLILRCKKPSIIIGQGIRHADSIAELKKFIEYVKFPVVSSRLGQDILPFSFPYYCGHGGSKGQPGVYSILKESDLIISIGSRLSIPFIGQNSQVFNKDAKIISIDLDRAELTKTTVRISLPIHGDAKTFLSDIYCKIIKNKYFCSDNYQEWLKRCIKYKTDESLVFCNKEQDPIDLYYFIGKIDQMVCDNHVFVSDAGSSYYACGQSLSFNKAKREITSGAFASMGLAVPLSIGCCMANPNIQVIAITGDGSIETNLQELKTLSNYKINAKIFIINNGGYVSIRSVQDKIFDGRRINSDWRDTDEMLNFSKVADTFNIPYFLISTYKDIKNIFEKVTSFNGPALIEVMCDPNQNIITCY